MGHPRRPDWPEVAGNANATNTEPNRASSQNPWRQNEDLTFIPPFMVEIFSVALGSLFTNTNSMSSFVIAFPEP